MAQSPQTCFPTIQPYKTALAEATASSASTGRGHICVQAVYDTMTAYYNACSNKAQSQYGFDLSVPDPEYGGPTTFYYYCLAKHKVQLVETAATATSGVVVKPTVALINQSYCSAGKAAYTNAVSFAKGGNDCTQQVMDGLNWYQQACGEQFLVSSFLRRLSSRP
ncbi:hypothetical protein BDR26DRAFT_135350 [Obelidium mucronatum]|nr:hypothetical protein BDR26DRAFT_135350 [Obelidium mucronatum]